MPKRLVVGNWKMNGNDSLLNEMTLLLENNLTNNDVDVAICPPFTMLYKAIQLAKDNSKNLNLAIGSQNVFYEDKGAFTGEVSPGMLVDLGCTYSIVGHSERRQIFLEDNATVAKKFKACVDKGLIPILCVGESQEQRNNGETFKIVSEQIKVVIDYCGIKSFSNAVIAYEPVWAIGTGLSAEPSDAQKVHEFIRGLIVEYDRGIANGLRILYGGSVNKDNASSLFEMADIDGGLIGGASLKPQDFLDICRA